MPSNVPDISAPLAEGTAGSVPPTTTSWLGCMAGTGRIIGDIMSPASEESDWEVLRGYPADRFLAATAKTFGLTLVTADENLIPGRGYSVLANR